jgi:hypothetical protein
MIGNHQSAGSPRQSRPEEEKPVVWISTKTRTACAISSLTVLLTVAELLFLLFLRRLWENRATWEFILDNLFLPGTPFSLCPVSVTKWITPAGIFSVCSNGDHGGPRNEAEYQIQDTEEGRAAQKKDKPTERTTSEIWRRAITWAWRRGQASKATYQHYPFRIAPKDRITRNCVAHLVIQSGRQWIN